LRARSAAGFGTPVRLAQCFCILCLPGACAPQVLLHPKGESNAKRGPVRRGQKGPPEEALAPEGKSRREWPSLPGRDLRSRL
jgi:hypothetical protein